MAKQPLGKTLLRNVIRHTGAHNKIQEEMEMWKTRGWEVHTSHDKHLPDTKSVRGQMHCDRVSDQPRDLIRSRERVSEHDDREARYWSRKLYEFKASDPDRYSIKRTLHLSGDIVASRSFILRSLKVTVKKAVPQERLGATKGKSPSLTQKQAYLNDQKNPLERRKRKRRRKMRRKSGRRRSAQAAAAMTAVLPKTSSRGKSLKVDTKTRKPKKTERETRTAARATVTAKKKGREGLAGAKSESRTPMKTQTLSQTQKRRAEKTGKPQVQRAWVIVLKTETERHEQTLSSGTDQGNYCRFLCSSLLYRGLFSAGPLCAVSLLFGRSVERYLIHLCSGLTHTVRQCRKRQGGVSTTCLIQDAVGCRLID